MPCGMVHILPTLLLLPPYRILCPLEHTPRRAERPRSYPARLHELSTLGVELPVSDLPFSRGHSPCFSPSPCFCPTALPYSSLKASQQQTTTPSRLGPLGLSYLSGRRQPPSSPFFGPRQTFGATACHRRQ